MECCRICLASNNLTNIFETEEIAQNITAIACVDVSINDDLPQYICFLCKHELDISITFKDKCETTFEMLKEQHDKGIQIKENIIFNLLSGANNLNQNLPKKAQEVVLNTVKNDIWINVNKNKCKIQGTEVAFNDETHEMEVESQEDQESITDEDDLLTDITENDYDIPENLGNLNPKNHDLMCLKCNFFFNTEKALFQHLQRLHPKTMGQCQICLSYFPTAQVLKHHLNYKHDVSDENDQINYKCGVCHEHFRIQAELNAHICPCSKRRYYQCKECEKCFKLQGHLDIHIKLTHMNIQFSCKQCKEVFDLYDSFRDHLKQHTIKVVGCKKCGMQFKDTVLLEKHQNLHKSRREFSSCLRIQNVHDAIRESSRDDYPNENKSKAAKNTGTDKEETYVCPLCEDCFKSNSAFQTHVRIHTGQKPFNCKECPKSFAQLSNLTAHQRSHIGIKPHVCSICQMAFYKRNGLENHLLQHSDLITCRRDQIFVLDVDNSSNVAEEVAS